MKNRNSPKSRSLSRYAGRIGHHRRRGLPQDGRHRSYFLHLEEEIWRLGRQRAASVESGAGEIAVNLLRGASMKRCVATA